MRQEEKGQDAHSNQYFFTEVQLIYSVVNFCCTVNLTQLYTYIHSFSYSFPVWFIPGYWIYFPVLYNKTLLFIHPICNNLHLLTRLLVNPFPTLSSLWQLQVYSLCPWLFHRYVYLCHNLDSTNKWYHMLFFWLHLVWWSLGPSMLL